VGDGDQHNRAYTHLRRTIEFADVYGVSHITMSNISGHCQVMMDVYPTASFQAEYNSSLPAILSATTAALFAIMALVFAIYDRLVNDRIVPTSIS
jgi:hypothetical protein